MRKLLDLITAEMELFLQSWTERMRNAGYLEHTTAKRDDCILSLNGIIEPLKRHMDTGGSLSFESVLAHNRELADFLVATGRRHKMRGISTEMFVGCFKTLVHAVEDIILTADLPPQEKLDGLTQLRRFFDAIGTIAMQDWNEMDKDQSFAGVAETNRVLTLDKNKYENIFQAASDIVLVMNEDGQVLEANAAAQEHFPNYRSAPVWELLGIAPGMSAVLAALPFDTPRELHLPDGHTIVSAIIVPLKRVSLASASYVIIMSDITCMADQRARLEQLVEDRTHALATSEKLFRSLFRTAGVGILLADTDLVIVEANQKAEDLFGRTAGKLKAVNCIKLFHPNSIDALMQTRLLQESQTWTGEMNGMNGSGDSFPASVTISHIDIAGESFFHIILRDITQQKALEEYLRQEKSQAEEMNVTLRNVLKTIDKEKEELERSIFQKVTTQIVPALQKLSAEHSPEIRQMYGDILKDQLVGLTRSAAPAEAEKLIKLSRSEIQVCQLIQSGFSSKDIAESMNISFDTVQTHRKNIRKKLGLSGKDVNLFAYLNNA